MSDNYRILDNKILLEFIDKRFTRKAKKLFGIKKPFLGKYRGKVIIENDVYSTLVDTYAWFVSIGGINIEDGFKIDAEEL